MSKQAWIAIAVAVALLVGVYAASFTSASGLTFLLWIAVVIALAVAASGLFVRLVGRRQ